MRHAHFLILALGFLLLSVPNKSYAEESLFRGMELTKNAEFNKAVSEYKAGGDIDSIFSRIRSIANKGFVPAINALGIMVSESDDYFKSINATSIDYFRTVRKREGDTDKSLEYFLLAASKDYADALYNIHILYEYGINVEIDYSKSAEYLKKMNSSDPIITTKIAALEQRAEEVRLEAERKAMEEAERAEAARLEAERQAEQERLAAEQRAKEETERAEAARIAAERLAKEEALQAEMAKREAEERAEAARVAAERRFKEEADRRAIEQAQELERVEKTRAELKARPVKSIDDGFRGMPWGIKKEEAIPIFGLYEHELGKMMGAKLYGRKDENLSLGNIPLLSLVYVFGIDAGATDDDRKGFISALLQFESKYFQSAVQEMTKTFGNPTLASGLNGEWHLKTVKITMKMSFDNPAASIHILRQFPEQQKQRGGGF